MPVVLPARLLAVTGKGGSGGGGFLLSELLHIKTWLTFFLIK